MSSSVAPSFQRKSSLYRYLYYIVSGLRLTPYASWKRDGEPNPFVRPDYRPRMTTRRECEEALAELIITSSSGGRDRKGQFFHYPTYDV